MTHRIIFCARYSPEKVNYTFFLYLFSHVSLFFYHRLCFTKFTQTRNNATLHLTFQSAQNSYRLSRVSHERVYIPGRFRVRKCADVAATEKVKSLRRQLISKKSRKKISADLRLKFMHARPMTTD